MQNIVFGIHCINILLSKHPEQIKEILISDKRLQNFSEIQSVARSFGISVKVVHAKVLDNLTENEVHQGIVAKVKPTTPLNEADLYQIVADKPNPMVLILDGVTDPQNLGACLRSADVFGASAIVVAKDRASKLTASAIKVSSGAAYTVPVVYVTNLVRTIETLKQEYNFWVYGAEGSAKDSIVDVKFNGAVALVLGSEGSGMRRLVEESCDSLIKIPMQGVISSLNVATTASIFMFEVMRQRFKK